MSDSNRRARLEKAQMRALLSVPFFAPGIARLPVIFDDETPTACTDGKRIKWGRKFFDSLETGQVVTVLAHEVAHCMLGHLWRAPDLCDWDVWNQATDHAINLMLQEFGKGMTAQNLADPFPFPEPKEAFCANPKYSGMAEEHIYAEIAKNKPPKPPSGGGKGKPGGGNKPAPGSMPSFGQIEKPADKGPDSKAAQQKLQCDWEDCLINSARIADARGELPAGLNRLVDNLTSNQVNWWDVLRSLLREQASDDYDFMTPAMEYSGSDFIMPSLRSDKCGEVVFATDTSGSIDQGMLAKFQGEKQNCLDEMRPKRLVDIYCDSQVHKVADYGSGDVISREAPGGGGTSFVPVWDYVREKLDSPPRAVVYLTDLFGDFGEDPGVPVIWVTWTKGGTAPFGQVIYAGEN